MAIFSCIAMKCDTRYRGYHLVSGLYHLIYDLYFAILCDVLDNIHPCISGHMSIYSWLGPVPNRWSTDSVLDDLCPLRTQCAVTTQCKRRCSARVHWMYMCGANFTQTAVLLQLRTTMVCAGTPISWYIWYDDILFLWIVAGAHWAIDPSNPCLRSAAYLFSVILSRRLQPEKPRNERTRWRQAGKLGLVKLNRKQLGKGQGTRRSIITRFRWKV